ncbi:MAG: hypothetical protein ABW120_11500, partial [Sedimenticola sp.]
MDNTSTLANAGRAHLARRSPRRILQYFFAYRLLIAGLLTLMFFSNSGPALLGHQHPVLFGTTVVIYLGFVTANGLLLNLLHST